MRRTASMVELESEGEVSRGEVAAFLREFANEIDDGMLDREGDPADRIPPNEESETAAEPNRVTFIVGGDSATVSVPDTVEFDVEVASRSPLLGSRVSQTIELELSWALEAAAERGDDDAVQIE